MEHPKHSAPPEAKRETATDQARETTRGPNRAERRKLDALNRRIESVDRQIERAEGKKP